MMETKFSFCFNRAGLIDCLAFETGNHHSTACAARSSSLQYTPSQCSVVNYLMYYIYYKVYTKVYNEYKTDIKSKCMSMHGL